MFAYISLTFVGLVYPLSEGLAKIGSTLALFIVFILIIGGVGTICSVTGYKAKLGVKKCIVKRKMTKLQQTDKSA